MNIKEITIKAPSSYYKEFVDSVIIKHMMAADEFDIERLEAMKLDEALCCFIETIYNLGWKIVKMEKGRNENKSNHQ